MLITARISVTQNHSVQHFPAVNA